MKTKLLTLVLIALATLLGCEKENVDDYQIQFGEEVFYWSGGAKILLYEIKGSYIVQMDTTLAYETALQKLKKNKNFQYVSYLNQERYTEIVVSRNLSLQEVRKQDGVINAIYQHTSNKSMVYPPISLDGTILLKPKSDNSMSDILALINNDAKIISGAKYETYVLEVLDWSKIFDYANLIYESGKVEYCHPNFSGGFKIFD